MKHDNMQEYSLPFAAWELRLYLDTHPDDAEAFAKYKAICAAAGDKCNYACHTTETVPVRRSRDSGCGCGGNSAARNIGGCGCNTGSRERGNGGCGCGGNSAARNIGGCGCDSNNGGGNYGGRRNDGGNFSSCGCENSGCGCNDDEVYNVWSWIDGPWPWEPEANNVGGNC